MNMEDFRSKSCRDARKEIQSYCGASAGPSFSGSMQDLRGPSFSGSMQDLRCYSASYASSVYPTQTQMGNTGDVKFKKGRSTNGSVSKSWSFNDPEMQRKRRVASYKVYTVEGKVKGSFKKSFRWLKDRCSRVVYGWW